MLLHGCNHETWQIKFGPAGGVVYTITSTGRSMRRRISDVTHHMLVTAVLVTSIYGYDMYEYRMTCSSSDHFSEQQDRADTRN